ncbi:MAG: hypothetical protein WC551_09430 [Patescibacteria group bacterium]|jgi:hypothetical protein
MTTTTTLDKFTRAYLVCALWAETDGDNQLDVRYSIDDFAPSARQEAIDDCQRFQAENAADLSQYSHSQCPTDELAGHDLWLTRNGHGAGYWDRDYLPDDVGNRLTQAAHAMGERYLYQGDDGMLYLS